MTLSPATRQRPTATCEHRSETEIARQTQVEARNPKALVKCDTCHRTRVVAR